MRNIILFCNQGMSTSLLVKKMEEAAKSMGYECTITAHPMIEAGIVGKDADIILLGPQVRFKQKEIAAKCPGIPVEVIDISAYGTMNGEKVIGSVKQTLGD